MKFYERLRGYPGDPLLDNTRHNIGPTATLLLLYQHGLVDRATMLAAGEITEQEEIDDFNALLDVFDAVPTRAEKDALRHDWFILVAEAQGDPSPFIPDAATLKARMLALVP